MVAISGSFTDSLIDANILTDTPGRIVLGMGWHNYIRYNEIHQAFRGTWENAEELYLVHGGVEAGKTVSFATGDSPESLVDTRQNWKPGSHRDSAVLMLSGRDFGQYRRVVDNSANTLRLDKPWNVAPGATSEYLVAPQFIENAFVGSTYTGIGVSAFARKAFLLNNEFDHVDNPIADHGDQTVRQGNKLVGENRRDKPSPALSDGRSERALPIWQPKAWTPDPAEQLPPLFYDVLSVKQLVSQPAYCLGRNVESEPCQHECQDHMKSIFELIRAYEKDHGQLPRAAFYPEQRALDADSLPVLLGRKPGGLFICPTCGVELRGLGLNYVWNQKVGGKRLSEMPKS